MAEMTPKRLDEIESNVFMPGYFPTISRETFKEIKTAIDSQAAEIRTSKDITSQQNDIMQRQAERIAELEAVVERMAHTGDGLPITFADALYGIDGRGKVVKYIVFGISRLNGADWVVELADPNGGTFVAYAKACYSTREAAEAGDKCPDT